MDTSTTTPSTLGELLLRWEGTYHESWRQTEAAASEAGSECPASPGRPGATDVFAQARYRQAAARRLAVDDVLSWLRVTVRGGTTLAKARDVLAHIADKEQGEPPDGDLLWAAEHNAILRAYAEALADMDAVLVKQAQTDVR